MKSLPFFLSILVVLASACSCNKENKPGETVSQGDSLVPFQVTMLAELPESRQPKTFLLEKMPKPVRKVVSKNSSITKMLPVLQNEKGEPILDDKGKPFILGDGGKSNFTNFTTDNGLALDGITCSVKDKSGNLWFGSNGGGVSRYDGKSFTSFTIAHGLANNNVISITEDKSGNLWFGTYSGGVSRYNGNSFTSFTTAQGLANNVVYSIMEDKSGNLWFGTYGGGVSRFDGKSFTSFTTSQGLANNIVWCINEDNAGNLWFGTNGNGVSRYDGKSFTSFTTTQGLTNNVVWCINKDKAGHLWFGTNGGGVSRYDGKSFMSFTTAQGLANNLIASITQDKAGNLWFGTYGGGVSRYDGESFTSFTTAQGLANNYVNCITEDLTGNLWFGTIGGGVSRYEGKSFTSFTTDQGLANNIVWCVNEDKTGNLWFGTNGGGVSRYDRKSFTNFTTDMGLANNIVLSIYEDKTGNLWFGTNGGGVSRYDGKSFTNFTTTQGLAKNSVNCITEDLFGNLWFGTNDGGVSRYDGKSFTSFTSEQGLASNNVRCVLKDKAGTLWFGTRGSGISRYDGRSFSSFTAAQGLANNVVYSIMEDKTGNLWFGTSEGLSLMSRQRVNALNEKSVNNKATISGKIFNSFTIADGLPHNSVTQVIQLPNGQIAVGTNVGLSLFNISEDFKKLIKVETYNTKTGYPIKDVNVGQNGMFLNSNGLIWVGTGSEKTALVRFDYTALEENIKAPNLVIQSIKVSDENISWYNLSEKSVELDTITTPAYLSEEVGLFGRALTAAERVNMRHRFGGIRFDGMTRFYHVPINLVLPYEHNQISFEFAAIETGKPFLVNYQYKLEGYDKDWSQATNRSNASFGNIREGTYTFKVKAIGPNGVWCNPIAYSFKVIPPWFRSWWAYTAYILFFLMALRIIIKWRERHLIKEKQILEEKVNQRTIQLNQSLENLRSTQAQLIQSEKMASLGELTAGIAHEIQNPLNFVNNFSELNKELVTELNDELAIGNEQLAKDNKQEVLLKIKSALDIAKDLKENSEKINQHGQRASNIVKGMLEHSRKSSGVKELTDINKLCEEFVRLSYHGLRAKDSKFNCDYKLDLDPNLPLVNVVSQDIGRVLLNIINNAFQACNDKSLNLNKRIEHTKSQSDADQALRSPELVSNSGARGNNANYSPLVIVNTKYISDKIEIIITDNGSGISDSIKDKIFQPFFTTKPTGQGTGLGLSLSYDIVKAHGGEIKVNTKENEGSEFIIQFPLN